MVFFHCDCPQSQWKKTIHPTALPLSLYRYGVARGPRGSFSLIGGGTGLSLPLLYDVGTAFAPRCTLAFAGDVDALLLTKRLTAKGTSAGLYLQAASGEADVAVTYGEQQSGGAILRMLGTA